MSISTTTFRLDNVSRKMLSKFAKQDGTSMTDVIRRLLRERSEKEPKEDVFWQKTQENTKAKDTHK